MNQSPYMRAYEAGVKLAQSEFFGKYARNPGEPSLGVESDYVPTEQELVEDLGINFDDYDFEDDQELPPPREPTEQELVEDLDIDLDDIDMDFDPADPANPGAYADQELEAMEQQELEDADYQPEYFEAQGGYGRMARNLRDLYQSKMDSLYDIPVDQLSEEDFNAQMEEYEDLADISGSELAQMYGNQALQAGDQLDMDDLADRYYSLTEATEDNPYIADPVTVMRRGRERQLDAAQARASRREPAPAPAPAPAAAAPAPAAPAPAAAAPAPAAGSGGEAAALLANLRKNNRGRGQANPELMALINRAQSTPSDGRGGPLLRPGVDTTRAPASEYVPPSGQGDLGGMRTYTTDVRQDPYRVESNREVSDRIMQRRGLANQINRSAASRAGTNQGPDRSQRARLNMLAERIGDQGRVTLTNRGGEQVNVTGAELRLPQVGGRGQNTSRPAITPKSFGQSNSAAPRPFNMNTGVTGRVMAQNRQTRPAQPYSGPRYSGGFNRPATSGSYDFKNDPRVQALLNSPTPKIQPFANRTSTGSVGGMNRAQKDQGLNRLFAQNQ